MIRRAAKKTVVGIYKVMYTVHCENTLRIEFHFFTVCPDFDDIRELYFKPEWKNAITTKQAFYNIMSSNAKSDILSVAKYLLSSFSLRKELLHTV